MSKWPFYTVKGKIVILEVYKISYLTLAKNSHHNGSL